MSAPVQSEIFAAQPAQDANGVDRSTGDLLSPTLPTRAGDRVRWSGLQGSALGLALASAARGDGARPLIVVTADNHEAERLEAQIRFYAGGPDVLELMHVPDWETLPYDVFSPHHDIVSERLATLHRLPGLERGVVITPITTAMVRIAPREFLDAESLMLRAGDRLDVEPFRARLEAAGYRYVSQVMEHGEFAVRGSLLDLFPMGAKQPLRIDLFDDEIETLRTFDPETQRTADRLSAIELLPAREFPMTEAAIARFRQRWRARFEGDPAACPIYRDISQGLIPAGIEYYLPLFFEHTGTLFDQLPANALIVHTEGSEQAAHAFWTEITERHEQARHDRERPLLDPIEMFVPVDEFYGCAANHPQVRLSREEDGAETRAKAARGEVDFATLSPPSLPIEGRAEDPLKFVKDFLARVARAPGGGRVLFAAESTGRRETLLESFRHHGVQPAACAHWQAFAESSDPVAITVAPIDRGLVLPATHQRPQ
ncbi:MAG: transcription-repair coupling factor, partial [Gammaproteobacteria bacterium]